MCQPEKPEGWLGPIAYWTDEAGSDLPDCPSGYNKPTDLHAEPTGDPATCGCTCTPTEQRCGTTDVITVFGDLDCVNACAHAGVQECSEISGCSGASLSLEGSVEPPVGSCEEEPEKQVGSVTWQRDARLCALESGPGDACGDLSCFPTPSAPFASQLCVYRVVLAGQAAPACPEAYPNGPDLLYSTFEDERDCDECRCTDLIGGECNGQVSIGTSSSCGNQTVTYKLGDPCLKDLQSPKSVAVEYELTEGTCGVATEPKPIGEVLPSGNFHAVCCL